MNLIFFIAQNRGRVDVLVGAIGGIFGGLVFTLYYDKFKLIMGSNLGNTTLIDLTKGYETISVLIFGIALIVISIIIPLKQELDEADLKQLDD